MVAVVARHAEKSALFGAGERAHPTNERNKLEDSVCGDLQRFSRLEQLRGLSPSRLILIIDVRELLPGVVGHDEGRTDVLDGPRWRECVEPS